MNLTTLRKLVFEKNVLTLLRLGTHTKGMYRCAFATSAGSAGVLALLAESPRGATEIAQAMQLGQDKLHALEAWLACGVKAGELALRQGRYRLKGKLSRLLAQPRNGIGAALFEEVARYHYDAILHAPRRLRDHQPYTLDDQDGDLIARSSQILEPLVEEAIDWAFAERTPSAVLEVGCGAGHYLRHMAQRAARLRLSAIDVQPNVVALAWRNLQAWGIAERVDLCHADVFDLNGPLGFDLVTLHNNIYYFSAERRVELLRRLRRLMPPSGRLLLTTSCRGGSPSIAALHLWWTLSDVAAGLPEHDALVAQLHEAGFARVRTRRLLPGESYHAFLAETDPILPTLSEVLTCTPPP